MWKLCSWIGAILIILLAGMAISIEFAGLYNGIKASDDGHKITMQRFSYAFAARPAIRRTLLLGGGAFSYPRYYLKNYPNCTIDVVEISEDVLKIDEAYFGLNDLKTERMQIIAEDGFSYLKETKETYDLIINDAFLGSHGRSRRCFTGSCN